MYDEIHGQGILTPRRPSGPRPVPAQPPLDLVPVLQPALDARDAAWREFAERVTAINARRRKITRGDEVSLTVRAYVQDVDEAAGTVALAETREPFAAPITLDRCHGSRLTFHEAAPAEPRNGDTITGRQVRETPWRRGTTLIDVTPGMDSEGHMLVLTGYGSWVNVSADCPVCSDDLNGEVINAGPPIFTFEMFGDDERFEVMYAPGKADEDGEVVE